MSCYIKERYISEFSKEMQCSQHTLIFITCCIITYHKITSRNNFLEALQQLGFATKQVTITSRYVKIHSLVDWIRNQTFNPQIKKAQVIYSKTSWTYLASALQQYSKKQCNVLTDFLHSFLLGSIYALLIEIALCAAVDTFKVHFLSASHVKEQLKIPILLDSWPMP